MLESASLWSPVPMTSCRITDPFWLEWQRVVIQQSLPHQWEMSEETGRIDNFRKTASNEGSGHRGNLYNDSDVYKWAEAAAYAAWLDPMSPTRVQLAETENLLAQAQAPDGYLDTYYQLSERERWTALCSDHEMYCMGHLIEAGCAQMEVLGHDGILKTALKTASLLAAAFGPEKRLGYCGHQELELALCRLSDVTGDPQWRELGRWMTMRRGGRPSPFEQEARSAEEGSKADTYRRHFLLKGEDYDGRYLQDDIPLEDQAEPVGHSVRAMYFYCGAHDSFPGGMPPKLAGALSTIWRRLIDRRTYITGGIGSSAANEGFTHDYDLPNLNAYAETCAGIGLILWASRMARMTQETEPLDILERALYNAVLSGLSQDGRTFFYDNPLESEGTKQRSPWFDCACCPPNVARLILSLSRFCASSWPGGVAINLLCSSRIEAEGLTLEVVSGLPWNGEGEVRILAAPDEEREIKIRAPGWARDPKAPGFERDGRGWLSRKAVWRAGDSIPFDFSFSPVAVEPHPEVEANQGRQAVMAGPLVYCLEEADLGGKVQDFRLGEVGGMEPLSGLGTAQKGVRVRGERDGKAADPLLIPYYAWANRGPGSMMVWMKRH